MINISDYTNFLAAYLSTIDDWMVYLAPEVSASSAGGSSPSFATPLVTTVPSLLHKNVMAGAPVALQLKVPTSPLSEADLALAGDLSILGASKIANGGEWKDNWKLLFQVGEL